MTGSLQEQTREVDKVTPEPDILSRRDYVSSRDHMTIFWYTAKIRQLAGITRQLPCIQEKMSVFIFLQKK